MFPTLQNDLKILHFIYNLPEHNVSKDKQTLNHIFIKLKVLYFSNRSVNSKPFQAQQNSHW